MEEHSLCKVIGCDGVSEYDSSVQSLILIIWKFYAFGKDNQGGKWNTDAVLGFLEGSVSLQRMWPFKNTVLFSWWFFSLRLVFLVPLRNVWNILPRKFSLSFPDTDLSSFTLNIVWSCWGHPHFVINWSIKMIILGDPGGGDRSVSY